MIKKLGFRNILRNRRRTIITCLIMGIGLGALIFADAFLHGLTESMISSVTSSFIGDGQIHQKDFLKTREIEKIITNADDILTQLKNDSRIKTVVPRAISTGMISSPTDVLPIAIYGIIPDDEVQISGIKSSIIKGNYLTNEDMNQILIGEKLAKFLGVDVGDKIVLTSAQSKTGQLAQELLRIGGIYKMKNKDMDSSMAFIHLSKAQSIMGIGNSFHELVFKFKSKADVINPPDSFLAEYSKNDNEALSWKKLVPAIDAGIQLTSYSLYIGSFILFSIIALSTMNTLFMSLYERMYEFGILKAMGTRSFFIFKLIIVEAFSLSILSTILGITIGIIAIVITKITGINYLNDVEYLGTTIKSSIYPVILVHQFLIYPLAITLFACISAIYPAISAAKIIPSESMRRD
jgi:ABC-type lipoprotein release transport system permease subunit